MKYVILSFSFLLSYYAPMISMEDTSTYQQATENQICSIVNIINNHAAQENDKICVLPKIFREKNITDAIANKKLYCAIITNTHEVAAFKKFFIINNQKEYEHITLNELRCTGQGSMFNKATSFNPYNEKDDLFFDVDIPWSFENSIIFYNGSDYTVPAYRGKRINSLLMEHAFNSKIEDVKKIILNKKVNYIVFLYGLTRFNTGKAGGIDRTPSIVRALRNFINTLFTHNTNNIIHKNYIASMPLFDPESTQLIPLKDKSIAKYGNVLIFPLNNIKNI